MASIRRTLAACGVALLVLAGCSGDDDDNDAASTTTAAGPTTTVRVDPSFTGQNSERFCGLARTYNERFTSVGTNPTPAELRTLTREGQTAITEAVNAAPAEIKADVEILARTFGALVSELEKVDFDATRLNAASLQVLQAPEFQRSSQRFQAYLRDVCKVSS